MSEPQPQGAQEQPAPALEIERLGLLPRLAHATPIFVGTCPTGPGGEAVAIASAPDHERLFGSSAPDADGDERVHPGIESAVRAALAKDPADRPASAAAFAGRLRVAARLAGLDLDARPRRRAHGVGRGRARSRSERRRSSSPCPRSPSR